MFGKGYDCRNDVTNTYTIEKKVKVGGKRRTLSTETKDGLWNKVGSGNPLYVNRDL